MKRYEMPPDGDAAESLPVALESEHAEYSLEEQVRRTSESVERLAALCAQFITAIAAKEEEDADA